MTRRYHANNYFTTLASSLSASALTMTVTSVTGLPAIGAGETYRLTISSNNTREIVTVTSASGTTLTITRASEGTTALAFISGSIVELRATADSFDRKADMISTSGDVLNFGDATSLEIPNNATATLSAAGQIALDTSVSDYADGVLVYRAGSVDYGVIAIPKSDLASPSNSYVVTYNAATDKFVLAATATTAPGGSTTQVQYNSSGAFAGAAGFTFDGTGTATLSVAVVVGGNSTASGYMRLLEDSDNGSNYIQLQAASSMAGNDTYTLPNAYPGSNGYLLSCTTAGVMSWVAAGSGGVGDVVGPASSTDNAITRFDSTTGKLIQNSTATLDDNGNISSTNVIAAYATTATAAGTTTLTVASAYLQRFTGSTTQTVQLPVTSTLTLGHPFFIVNDSTGNVTINSSGGNAVYVVLPGTSMVVQCILTSGTTAASWYYYGMSAVSATLATADRLLFLDVSLSNKLSYSTQTGITQVGTINSGIWNASTVDVGFGGTGWASYTQGDILYASATTTLLKLAKDTNATRYLSNQGTNNNPSWNQINLANGVTGILPVANGGAVTWTEVTGTSQTAAVLNAYIANNASLVTITLPATAAVGDTVEVVGKGAGLWRLTANTGQTVKMSGSTTTSAGSLTATSQYDSIAVVCITANTTWAVRGPVSSGFTIA